MASVFYVYFSGNDLFHQLFCEVLITIVLLLSWTDLFQGRDYIDTIDFFAGAARVAKVSRAVGKRAMALDLSYHENEDVFNINSSPGFALLRIQQSMGIKLVGGIYIPGG